jgi:hypothetical protein
VILNKLTGTGYPGGGQSTLGAMAGLIRTDVPWCYQAFLAFTAGMGALAAYGILGSVTRHRLLRAAGGALALQPNILYGYTLEGGIKELTTAALVVTTIALLNAHVPGEGPHRRVLPAAVAFSASFAAFSFGIAPWLGLVVVGMVAVALASKRDRRRHVAECWGVLAGVAVLLSLPSLITAVKLATLAGGAVGGVVNLGLGNLAAPVPDWSSAGVWLTSDYRYPLMHTTATHIFDVLVIVLAVVGIAGALRARRWALGLLGLATPIALYYWIAHTGPWIQLKAFCVTAAIALLLAFAGVGALGELRRRSLAWLGWAAGAVVAGAVLYGNATIYHSTSIAPAARYHDLAAIGKRYAAIGPALFPAFDEYAEYFLREEHATDLVNPAYGRFPLAQGVSPPPGGVSFTWDLNQISPQFVQGFRLIIIPRSPVATRPPSNFDLVQQTRYFDVWRRDRPAARVLAHFPLASSPTERAEHHFCPPFVSRLRAMPGAVEIAYARPAPASVTGVALGAHPSYWHAVAPNTVLAYGAGTARMQLAVPQAGRYSLWMQGSIGRPLAVYLDGRRVTSIGYEERYPDQFLLLGEASLRAGPHTLRIVRGNGSLHPGSGDPASDTVGRTLGAIVVSLHHAQSDRVYVASRRDAAKVCDAHVGYQWLELLAPGARPPSAIPLGR